LLECTFSSERGTEAEAEAEADADVEDLTRGTQKKCSAATGKKGTMRQKAICAKDFGARMLNVGGSTFCTRPESRGKEVPDEKEQRNYRKLAKIKNERQAHKRREQTCPVLKQVGIPSHSGWRKLRQP
jgi:hypothetical protein